MAQVIALFNHHPYIILFLGTFLELLALPISAELLMSCAGYLVYADKMNYIAALFTAYTAAGAGISSTFWIGKAGGYKLIEKYGRYIHFGPERYKRSAAWLERSGSKLLIFAYFIPGIRHVTGYISGISRMRNRKFFIPAYLGIVLWGTCFITAGRLLGPKWKAYDPLASKLAAAIMIAGILIGAFIFIVRCIKKPS